MTVGTPILGNHHMANDKAEVMAYAKAAFWSIGDDLQIASVLYTDHGSPSKHFKIEAPKKNWMDYWLRKMIKTWVGG